MCIGSLQEPGAWRGVSRGRVLFRLRGERSGDAGVGTGRAEKEG